jgi:hypothetical protein
LDAHPLQRLPRGYADEPAAGLSRGEVMIVQLARQAFGQAIEQFAPGGSNKLALAVTAISGLFADTVCRMSNAADILRGR